MLGKEDIEQVKLFDWIRSKPELEPFCFHVANERKCTQMAGRLLKRKGVKPGVSDNFIAIPRGTFHGMFVELKIWPNKPTPLQELFINNMQSKSYYCVVAYSCEEAKLMINDYLSW